MRTENHGCYLKDLCLGLKITHTHKNQIKCNVCFFLMSQLGGVYCVRTVESIGSHNTVTIYNIMSEINFWQPFLDSFKIRLG